MFNIGLIYCKSHSMQKRRSSTVGASAEGDSLHCRHPPTTCTTAGTTETENVRQPRRVALQIEPTPVSCVDDLPKPKRILKKQNGGALASATCDFCPMPTNHYCRFVLPSSNVTIEGREDEPICAVLACMNCKSKWPGEPEDYANRCINHKR